MAYFIQVLMVLCVVGLLVALEVYFLCRYEDEINAWFRRVDAWCKKGRR